ncbi:MAG: sulfite exporter TauE/SafE family protein [Myxococcota bacterium]|nr:sulfite exporter TauE/SafE family protein [Myxococcota bacterium]
MLDRVMELNLGIGDLEIWQAGLLVSAGIGTSIISAIVGMGGGITLLATFLLFLDPLIAIPLLAVVQLVSNSSRGLIHRNHIQWKILWPYLLPLLPLGWWSLELAQKLPPDVTRSLIGLFVLVATWRPGWLLLGAHPGHTHPKLRFFGLGIVAGFLNVTFGATGPLIAPFFLNLGLSRFQLIGTKAACQMGSHIAKIVIFGIAGFAYAQWAGLLSVLCLSVIFGTWLGTRILGHVNEVWFVRLYRLVLTVIALSLALESLPAWMGISPSTGPG